jgi:hypothetical protein
MKTPLEPLLQILHLCSRPFLGRDLLAEKLLHVRVIEQHESVIMAGPIMSLIHLGPLLPVSSKSDPGFKKIISEAKKFVCFECWRAQKCASKTKYLPFIGIRTFIFSDGRVGGHSFPETRIRQFLVWRTGTSTPCLA